MTSLSTLEGQRQHYSEVRDRLWSGETPPEKPRRIVHLPQNKPRDILPIARKRQVDVPHQRDFIQLGQDVVHPLPSPRAWRVIVSEVCIAHNVSYLELCSNRRAVHIAAARHEAAYRLHHETTMSLPQIGNKLGGKDHTTILYGIRRHDAKLRGQVYRKQSAGKSAERQAHEQ